MDDFMNSTVTKKECLEFIAGQRKAIEESVEQKRLLISMLMAPFSPDMALIVAEPALENKPMIKTILRRTRR